MEKFKKHWEIQHNWQLIFPFLGIIILGYSAFKISNALLHNYGLVFIIIGTLIISYLLLKFTLFLFKKLEKKWILDNKWEMIRVFIVFAVTGSSSLYVGRPIIKLMGITKENLNPVIYWILFIIIGLIFYQILLVTFGWLFGQFKFFWEFEKKMLRRMGLKRFLD
jgi:MFS family permease